MNKYQILKFLKKAVSKEMDISFCDTFDGTIYTISDVEIDLDTGKCYICANICGCDIDDDYDDIDDNYDDYDDIDDYPYEYVDPEDF